MNKNYEFKNIVGYNDEKEELLTFVKLFKEGKEKEFYPRGILFTGPAGCGKTSFIRQFSKMLKRDVFVISGNYRNICSELSMAFEKAEALEGGIIVIDELDLLIKEEYQLVRLLQQLIDGYKEYNNVLVLAATNNLSSIPESLKRPGRFDKIIKINYPDFESRCELIKYYVNKTGNNENDIDVEYLSRILDGLSCSKIKTVINQSYLRNHTLSTENIEEEFYINRYGKKFKYEKTESNIYKAYHEAGHALLIYKYSNYFKFYSVSLQLNNDYDGLCTSYQNDVNDKNIEKYICRIEISLAAYLALKIIFKVKTEGASEDLLRANYYARYLVNTLGYMGISKVLREYDMNARNETEINCHRNEKIAQRILKKCERNAKKYLLKNKDKLIKVADYIYENGRINATNFYAIMKGEN